MLKRISILIVAVSMAIIPLIHVYLLGLGIALSQPFTFWLPLLVLGFLAFYVTITFNSKLPLVLILIFSFTLHLIQFVRQPFGMVWNNDAIFGLQVVEHVLETGRWDFGYGTGSAFSYSFYPLFYVFQSIFSFTSGIPVVLIVKYSMAVLNLLTLMTLYVLVKRLFKLDNKSTNLIVLMFSLNPMFHFFNSYFHAESYAIIFYPLVLLYLLRNESYQLNKQSISVIAILMLATISMAHHLTSYIIGLSVIPVLASYIVWRKSMGRVQIYLLALVFPTLWLMFIAPTILSAHVFTFEQLLSSLVHLHIDFFSTPTASHAYYASELSLSLSWLRNMTLLSLTVTGLVRYRFNENKKSQIFRYFVVLLFLLSTIAIISLFGGIWGEAAGNRTRFLEFAYFPIAIFSGLGIGIIVQKQGIKNLFKQRASKSLFILALVILFVPPTIFNAFARFNYDPAYYPSSCDEYTVAPEQKHALGLWVQINVNSSGPTVLTGSGDYVANRYIIGYGQFQGPWYPDLFNVTLIGEPLPYLERYTLYYVVNINNLQLPDTLGRKLNEFDIQFLDAYLNNIYDNNAMSLYRTYPD